MLQIDDNGKVNYKDVVLGNFLLILTILILAFCWYNYKQSNIIEQHTYTENGITYRYTLEQISP